MTRRAVPLIPRALLFGNPVYLAPGLSPDGTRLRFLAPDEGVLNVWAGPADAPDEAKPVTRDRGRGIRSAGFCHDDRTLYYLRDRDGDESWRLYLVDLETGAERCVTPFEGVQTRVLAHNSRHPGTMLIGLNRERPELHDVYRLDLATGDLTRIAANPGYLSWEIDTDLRVRGGTAMNPDGSLTVHLTPPGADEPVPWLEVPREDAMGTRIAGYARDGRTIYLLSSIGANATRLYSVDAGTGRRVLLAEDPVYDVKSLEVDPVHRLPQAVLFGRDRDERMFLDAAYERAVTRLGARLAELGVHGELDIDRSERGDRRWVVAVVACDGPVRYYVYDRHDDRLRFLFSHQPELERYRLAEMEPFVFAARDGVEVHGYVTWPPGVERRDLPAVVNVHGGPWWRNSWCFDEEAQFLANRGYACVQVNFRGSVGYGKEFHNLGAKQWGAGMHTDLLDAVAFLAGRGAVDPARVAIMGCSYGGYAALAGAAFTPRAFACAIDLCGPSNLLTLLAGGASYRRAVDSFMHAHVGDPETERDLLWERSPLSRAGDITIPLLIVQGANDVRVPRQEAEQIVAALRAKGVPHEYLLFENEGHGLLRPENRETYYAAVERFLAEHLA
ncbi:S9 family peptidase [Nonomuraea candida]|uniref:S9 family peptidase n=1 Tax=Nonomuraea candida TaxID=359159 RepID=UPI0005BADC11|nr:S9 family peptidase [Nonomuraea candida]